MGTGLKSHYITDLTTTDIDGRWKYIDHKPFCWYSAEFDLTGCNPIRFTGDEASVPRWPILFWFFGGKAPWPAWGHDMLYRWPFDGIGRIKADRIFHDMHIAYHEHLVSIGARRSNILFRAGRSATRGAMTTGVVIGGWVSYKSYPGCLDYREAERRKCRGNEIFCQGCDLYYPLWRQCIRPGYHPTLWKEHMV